MQEFFIKFCTFVKPFNKFIQVTQCREVILTISMEIVEANEHKSIKTQLENPGNSDATANF